MDSILGSEEKEECYVSICVFVLVIGWQKKGNWLQYLHVVKAVKVGSLTLFSDFLNLCLFFFKAVNQRDRGSKIEMIYVNEALQQPPVWERGIFLQQVMWAKCGTLFITKWFLEIRKIFVIRNGMP